MRLPALTLVREAAIKQASCPPAQVLWFDLSTAAPDPTTVDMSAAVAGILFQARAVRVTASTSASTALLVGGVDTTYPNRVYSGVLVYGSVAAGSSIFHVTGRVLLPSFGSGVTALSQTSPLHPGFVLASTDEGVFKCVREPQSSCQPNSCTPARLDAYVAHWVDIARHPPEVGTQRTC